MLGIAASDIPLKSRGWISEMWNEQEIAQLRDAGKRKHKKSVGIRGAEGPILLAE